jgi:hypothetical protein
MPRPKRLKDPKTLNLLISNRAKRKAFAMAVVRDLSVSRLFERLIEAEDERGKGNVGSVHLAKRA